VAGRSGDRIYFLGTDPQAMMECYTGFHHERLREDWLGQAVRITYSHDGQWVAWTTVNGSLWRSRIDGSERLQLIPPDMKVFLADWSPDSSRLALMARKPDQAWHVYLIPSTGGLPQLAFDDDFNVGDPSWGPSGQTLVFGRLNGVMGKDSKIHTLQFLDLRNRHIDTVPGSEGLYSPRWSPDGRYIAALSLDSRKVMLFSVADRRWVRLPLSSGADPHWSSDSRSLYVHEFAAPNQPIVRIGIPDARIEDTLNLVAPEDHAALEFTFSGVTPSGDILVRTRTNSANLYTMRVDYPNEK
jgi:dipeptidyl aminopeptidase/acylaminoacyl peptidase